MADEIRTTQEDEETVTLDVYPATFELEPCVGLRVIGTGNHRFWLSWDETQQLAEFLQRHVAA